MNPVESNPRAETEVEEKGVDRGGAETGRYVGARVPRIEDPRFLTGKARYVDNIDLPNGLEAAFVRSPQAHAMIKGIDVSAALATPGVHAVFTAEDFTHLAPMVTDTRVEGVAVVGRSVLADDRVRHVGEAVAIVVADSRYRAEDGVDLVAVEYEPLPVVMDAKEALGPDSPPLHDDVGSNVLAHLVDEAGDAEKAFAEADHVFTKRFHHGRSTAAPLEGRAMAAEYDSQTGRITLWVSTQIPHLVRTVLAGTLGVPEKQITVISPDVGGGFGLKCHPFPEEAAVATASMLLRRPVKWIEDRYENLASGVHSKEMICEMELATTSDGEFLGIRAHLISDAGAYGAGLTNAMVDVINAATGLPSIYDVDNVSYVAEAAITNKCPVGAVRGVGWSPGQTVRESLIEDAARELGIDPVELRLKNCIGPEPRQNAFGAKYDGGSYAATIELIRDRIDYEGFRERQREAREQGRYLGIGFSAFLEPGGLGCAGSAINRLPIPFYDLVQVTMEPDGSVSVTTGLHSHGQGHETSLAQVAADELGVTVDQVRVMFGNTDSAAYGTGTFASRSAVVGSGAITLAGRVVADRLRSLAAILLEAEPDQIHLSRGVASVESDPTRNISMTEVAGFGYFGAGARPQDVQDNGLTATRNYDPLETYGNGTVGAIVEVDPGTGTVSVLELKVAEDCGVMLNPMIVDGQVRGAVAQGVGVALLEDAAYGDDGQFLAGSLMDYLYPSTMDVPDIDVSHIETPSNASVNGVKGMGESGVIGTPAAIVNAISDALAPFGVTIEQTPVTPNYLLERIGEAAAAS